MIHTVMYSNPDSDLTAIQFQIEQPYFVQSIKAINQPVLARRPSPRLSDAYKKPTVL